MLHRGYRRPTLTFTDEQGTQLSSIQVEKVYMARPLKSALKIYQKRSSLWIPSIFQRGHPHSISPQWALPTTVFSLSTICEHMQQDKVSVKELIHQLNKSQPCTQDHRIRCSVEYFNMHWDILPKRGFALKPKNNRKHKLKKNTINVCWIHYVTVSSIKKKVPST